MKLLLAITAVGLLTSIGICETHSANATLPLAVVVHKSNPTENLSVSQLRRLFLGTVREWPSHKRVILVHRDAISPVFQALLRTVLHMTAPEYQRHALNLEFRGEEPLSIKILNSNEAACKFVFNVPGAVGIIDAAAILNDQVKVVRVDGKMPGDVAYILQ